MSVLRDAVEDSNPWWQGRFFEVALKERGIFGAVLPFLEKKQVVGIYGLRRTGKSFLLYYLLKRLLERENPKSIVYFSFDAFGDVRLSEIIKAAEEITGTKPMFVFLDEVQKMDNWAEQVKRLYDLSGTKMVVSGSESLFLKKTSKESLGGRIFEFEMKPLSFNEYLQFRGIEVSSLHETQIKKGLYHYLLTGGFPELVEENDPFFIRKYIKEGIIDKAIFREIPARFKIEDPSLVEKLLNIIIDNPGLLIDKNDLGKSLGIFRTTVSKYLFYLESSFLIKSLYNYSRNASTSEKKLKKYFPGFSCLGVGIKSDSTYFGKIVETACVLKTSAKFFWRTPQQDEVDIVLEKPLFPIEVKYQQQPRLKGMQKFRQKFNIKSGLVIAKETEKTEAGMRFVPFWKWLLEN